MTLQTMQWHEKVTLRFGPQDYRRKALMRLIKRVVTGKDVLDMRCLTGHLAVDLAEGNREVMGLDAYPEAVQLTNELARSRGMHNPVARLWELKNLAGVTGGKKFDTVICSDVLNHVESDEETIGGIHEVLKPGGELIILAPAFPAFLGKRDELMGHLRRYTKKQIFQMLERYGFRVKKHAYWNFIAMPVYFVVERWFKKTLSDDLRYARVGGKGTDSWLNRILGVWYTAVENSLIFPCGLSHFVIAIKGGSQSSL